MQVLLVEFGLAGMTLEELESAAPGLAPAFASIPGCIEKTWIVDREANAAGGVYKFRDRASVDAYLSSELFGSVRANPAFTHLTTRTLDVMERASEITGGLPAGAAAR
jgi:hypothetical protein